jgi:hypothetical protein
MDEIEREPEWFEAYCAGWCGCGVDTDALIDPETGCVILYRCPLCRAEFSGDDEEDG